METPPPFNEYRKYHSRAVAAIMSKYTLLLAAVVSVGFTCLPMGFGFESVLVSVILIALTYFEFRVYGAFTNLKPEAPVLGFRNQACFAAFILVYCLYHAFTPTQLPASLRDSLDPDMLGMIGSLIFGAYLTIGIVGGLSQIGLAWYYLSARNQREV